MTTQELRQKLLDLKLDLEYLENQCSVHDEKSIDLLANQIYREINETYLKLTSQMQEECDHNVWYLLRQDRSFNIVSNTCRCLECGQIRTKQADKFAGKIIGNNKSRFVFNEEEKYNMARNEYDNYVNLYGKEDSVKRMLQKYRY